MALAAYPELLLHNAAQETSNLQPASGRCPCLALLPMGVAWPQALLPAPVVSYTTFSTLPVSHSPEVSAPFGGLFLWPDPAGYPAPGVTRHCALRSADFPLIKA